MFEYRMKELYEIEKKPGDPSYPGVLKMVKVRKFKKGQKNSRSLVFRISRIPKVEFDDSGVSCSTPEDKTLSDDQIKIDTSPCSAPEGENSHGNEVQPAALKVKIPKSVLFGENVENEPTTSEAAEVSTGEHHSLETDLTLEKANQHLESSSKSEDNFNLHENPPSNHQATAVVSKTRKYEKPCEIRRSSRRILLRLQKEECQTSSLQAAENQTTRLQAEENQTTRLQAAENQTTRLQAEEYQTTTIKQEVCETTAPPLDVMTFKRKREPKPRFPGVECKRRRGRPPKSSVVNTLSNMKIEGSSSGIGKEKLSYPPKNSVWTLVPKELFESEFFKSQVLKFGFSSPVVKRPENSLPTPRNTLSPRIMTPTPSFSTPKIHLKYPNGFANSTPTMQPGSNSDTFKERKRPTVIYFKPAKKSLDFSTSQYVEERSTRQSQSISDKELSGTESDLMYLLRKYGMVEERILKSYYEQANGDVNETENMLSDFLLKNPGIPPNQLSSNFLVPKNNPVECSASASYFGSYELPYDFETEIFSDLVTPLEDTDTLSCSIIVESLRILFSPEAVLS